MFQTEWKFMVAAGNLCIILAPPQAHLCEILDGPYEGVHFRCKQAVFKSKP